MNTDVELKESTYRSLPDGRRVRLDYQGPKHIEPRRGEFCKRPGFIRDAANRIFSDAERGPVDIVWVSSRVSAIQRASSMRLDVEKDADDLDVPVVWTGELAVFYIPQRYGRPCHCVQDCRCRVEAWERIKKRIKKHRWRSRLRRSFESH